MTKPMDVDPPPGQEERKIAVHPLAIVNMSDQYTRITTGGSCLERTAAVEGLLFGQEDVVVTGAKPTPHRGGATAGATTTTTRRLQIKDADDIPLQQQEAATIQVSLHQAVFPQHVVVGWYRVAKQRDENSATQLQPTAHDLRQTRQLQQHYQEQQRQQQQTAATAATQRQQPPPVFVFALLQVPGGSSGGGSAQSGADSAAGKKEQREDDEEEALPLTLYELQHQQGNRAPVLVAVEDWILDTSASERVAVERVVREQPQHQQQRQQQQQQKKSASPQEGGGKGKSAAAAAAAAATIPSAYVNHVQQVQGSLHAIQDRLSVLVRFLQDVQRGKISPFPHALVRQVQGLLLQLGPVASLGGDATSQGPTHRDNPVLLRQLAVLAKTVDAVQSYSEKFRVVHEASSSSHHHHHRGMGREMRGGRF